MNRTRNLGGFSLVEMMLLLIIVSLMIASGVSVISKKHVKVPRLAMHGAYICYYNKEGKLHEEKYVGAGLSRRIWNEDVEVCRFVPPEKASYFYVQAVAGGGAGGSSGYTDEVAKAARKVFESQPEAIPPFGVSADWLELKGISAKEFSDYGGMLWAYGRGDGPYGDAGGGGDIFYIKRLANQCMAEQRWTLPADAAVCDYSSCETVYYKEYIYERSWEEETTRTCSDTYWWNYSAGSCDGTYVCNTWENTCSKSEYPGCETGTCVSGATSVYDDPDTEEVEEIEYCTSSYWGGCRYGSEAYTYTVSSQCSEFEGVPEGADCDMRNLTYISKPDYETKLQVQNQSKTPILALQQAVGTMSGLHPNDPLGDYERTKDDGSIEKGKYPNEKNTIKKTVDGKEVLEENFDQPNTSCENDDVGVRKIIVPKAYSATICNYGISANTGSNNAGITGSCFFNSEDDSYNDCVVACESEALQSAYGKLISTYGSLGETSINDAEEVVAGSTYFPNAMNTINGITYEGCIAYDLSEEKGGKDAYGQICETQDDPTCNTGWPTASLSGEQVTLWEDTSFETDWQPGGSYTSPMHSYWTTDANHTNGSRISYYPMGSCYDGTWDTNDSSNCDSDYSWSLDRVVNHSSCISKTATCKKDSNAGVHHAMGGCLHSSDSAGANNPYRYTYIIDHAEGGEGGKGHNCAFSTKAQKDLQYEGYATIVAGIKGSDRNLTGAYKGIYHTSATESNWGPWASQTTSYAEDGTDSAGMVYVSMGQSCTINQTPPTKGTGAYIVKSGTSITKYDGEHGSDGSFSGAGHDQFDQLPAGCSNNGHVGYCIVHDGGTVDPFGKYTFKYTWATSHLNKGEGGEPGEYRSMVIRSFKDRDMIVVPGLGGVTGACAGGAGGDTYIFTVPKGTDVDAADVATWDDDTEIDLTADGTNDLEVLLKVKGGAGGPGCIALDPEQLPYVFDSENIPKKSVGGGDGKRPTLSAKANIMGLVLPLDDSDLGKWLSYAGSSGHGGGSTNLCWTSSYERWFEGHKVSGDIGVWDEGEVDTACNHEHGEADPAATNGIPGAVVIKW